MRTRKVLFPLAVVLAFCMYSCSDTAVDTAEDTAEDILTYKVACSVSGLSADITYIDSSNEIVSLEDQSLPWSLSINIDSDFNNDAYLKAVVSDDDAFVYYLSGTTNDSSEEYKLLDDDADFITSGVEVGDMVFPDPDENSYALVTAVDDAETLTLGSDLFTESSMDYYIYKVKTLTVSILLNDTTEAENSVDSERTLNVLVKAELSS